MSRVTAGELKTRTLRYADMAGSERIEDDHLLELINLGLSELHDLVVNNNGEEYFRASTTFSVTSASESYPLPDDFYKALALYHLSNSRRFVINKWNPAEIGGAAATPLSSGTIEMWYIPTFRQLDTLESYIDIALPFGWDDFVALHAAARILIEEKADPSAVMSERERQRGRIVAMLSPRDLNEPESIGDVSGRWGDGFAELQIEPSYKYRIMGNDLYVVEVEYRGV